MNVNVGASITVPYLPQKTLVGMNKMFFDEEKEEDVVANLLLSYILLVASLERR